MITVSVIAATLWVVVATTNDIVVAVIAGIFSLVNTALIIYTAKTGKRDRDEIKRKQDDRRLVVTKHDGGATTISDEERRKLER